MSGLALPSMQFVVTPDHPFWVEGKGWVKAVNLTWKDVVVSQDGHKYYQCTAGYDTTEYGTLYKTAEPNMALLPYYGSENGMDAFKVDLTTGYIISWNDTVDYTENSTLAKLYNTHSHWEEDLLEQLPEEMREGAQFHGFRQGNYVDPKYVKWTEGEGEVTTTVYNIQVENTHTYFVGEYGIWVHNCDAEESTLDDLTVEVIESLVPVA